MRFCLVLVPFLSEEMELLNAKGLQRAALFGSISCCQLGHQSNERGLSCVSRAHPLHTTIDAIERRGSVRENLPGRPHFWGTTKGPHAIFNNLALSSAILGTKGTILASLSSQCLDFNKNFLVFSRKL